MTTTTTVGDPTVTVVHSNSRGAELQCVACQTVWYVNWTWVPEKKCPTCYPAEGVK